ncbi:MAG: ABC transporter permease [Lentisphaeria bacterium]|nr:ABC transporter permease [Lentisphaeria bacterium]
MFGTVYQIAKNTFRETVREPIYLLLLLAALCLIGVFPVFTLFVFRQQVKLVVDSALATTMVFGWLIAVLSASYAISREIDNGTVLLLLSKPVKRPTFIIAKILGIMASLSVFWVLTSIGTLISLRIAKDQFWIDNRLLALYFGAIVLSFLVGGVQNYVNRGSFPMSTVMAMLVVLPLTALIIHFIPNKDGDTYKRVSYMWEVVPPMVLILYSVWAMGTLATALSTRLNLVSNLLTCSAVFVVGLMSDYLIGSHAYEPWQDGPQTGQGSLWMSTYNFVPAETQNVEEWTVPVRVDDGTLFTVWSASKNPTRLPKLGPDPAAGWKDGADWKKRIEDVDGAVMQAASFDPVNLEWTQTVVAGEHTRTTAKDGSAAGFQSYVFRRSGHRPRTPVGGLYSAPWPHNGWRIATVLYACIPNWQLFWMADALAAKKRVPFDYVVTGGVYVCTLIGLFVLLAVGLFANREVGQQMTM